MAVAPGMSTQYTCETARPLRLNSMTSITGPAYISLLAPCVFSIDGQNACWTIILDQRNILQDCHVRFDDNEISVSTDHIKNSRRFRGSGQDSNDGHDASRPDRSRGAASPTGGGNMAPAQRGPFLASMNSSIRHFSDGKPTANIKKLPRHVACCLGGKEGHGGCDFVRLSHAL